MGNRTCDVLHTRNSDTSQQSSGVLRSLFQMIAAHLWREKTKQIKTKQKETHINGHYDKVCELCCNFLSALMYSQCFREQSNRTLRSLFSVL